MSTSASMAPLRIARFRLLWLASAVSNVGGFLQAVAASWLMRDLTGSATWVGLMVASSTLPMLVFALPAGALADLFDRRRILIASQLLMAFSAAAMTVLSVLGLTTPLNLLALGLLLGVGVAFSLPSWQALVPDLVPRDLVAGAVALNSASFNVARAVGPAIGGVLVATVGPSWAFGLNAGSFLFVVAAVASFGRGEWHSDRESSLRSAIALGVRYARFTPVFVLLLFVASAFGITSASIQALLPNLTGDVLGAGAGVYGLLLGAMGVGALGGAFSRHWASERLRTAMVPASIASFGLVGILVGVSRSVPLTAGLMAVEGVFWVWTLATLNATTQLLAPSWVRGRIMSLYTLAFVGFIPLGSILAGVLGDLFSIPTAIVAMCGAVVVLGAVASRLPLPALADIESPETPKDFARLPHALSVEGGPVVVLTTWVIDAADLDAYLETMNAVRQVRLRTGAYRWRLYRNVDNPHRMTESMLLTSWDQHLRQHDRLSQADVQLLSQARSFDRADGPVTHHLAAIDVAHRDERPTWDRLQAVAHSHGPDDTEATVGEVPEPAPVPAPVPRRVVQRAAQ